MSTPTTPRLAQARRRPLPPPPPPPPPSLSLVQAEAEERFPSRQRPPSASTRKPISRRKPFTVTHSRSWDVSILGPPPPKPSPPPPLPLPLPLPLPTLSPRPSDDAQAASRTTSASLTESTRRLCCRLPRNCPPVRSRCCALSPAAEPGGPPLLARQSRVAGCVAPAPVPVPAPVPAPTVSADTPSFSRTQSKGALRTFFLSTSVFPLPALFSSRHPAAVSRDEPVLPPTAVVTARDLSVNPGPAPLRPSPASGPTVRAHATAGPSPSLGGAE